MANKGIIFYDDWCDMVNQYYNGGDKEAAQALSFAIIRLYSTGEILKLPRSDLDMMLQYTIKSGLDTQVKNYSSGAIGGRPSKLSEEDHKEIAGLRSNGYTAKEIASKFNIGEATVRRAKGWKDYQNPIYHNIIKPLSYQNQNQEEEEEEMIGSNFDKVAIHGQDIDAYQDYWSSDGSLASLQKIADKYNITIERLRELAQSEDYSK